MLWDGLLVKKEPNWYRLLMGILAEVKDFGCQTKLKLSSIPNPKYKILSWNPKYYLSLFGPDTQWLN